MAKPPATPLSSDIDGVDEDRRRIDRPAADGTAKPNDQLGQQKAETRGRPPGGGR